jgi:hypothetical protein
MIMFYGSGSSSSLLNGVTVEYGREIECVSGANVTIQYSTLWRNQNGVYCFAASPTIQYNKIYDIQYHAIICHSGSTSNIWYNNLYKENDDKSWYQEYCGIWLDNSSPRIAGNTLQGFNFAIYPTYYSSPYFWWSGGETPNPNNLITDNLYAFVVYFNSNPRLGYYDIAYEDWVGAYNGIYNNYPDDMVVYPGCTVYAQQNWWGDSYAPQAYICSGGTLYWQPPLYTNPWPQNLVVNGGKSVAKVEGSSPRTVNANAISKQTAACTKDDLRDSLFKALSLRRQKNFTEAQKLYKRLLMGEKSSQTALSELADMFMQTKDDAILEYFKSLRSNNSSYPFAVQNRALTTELLASMYTQKEEYSNAKQLYDEVIARYAGTPQERHARFQKFYLALYVDRDRKAAGQIFDDIRTKYSDGMDIEFAQYV